MRCGAGGSTLAGSAESSDPSSRSSVARGGMAMCLEKNAKRMDQAQRFEDLQMDILGRLLLSQHQNPNTRPSGEGGTIAIFFLLTPHDQHHLTSWSDPARGLKDDLTTIFSLLAKRCFNYRMRLRLRIHQLSFQQPDWSRLKCLKLCRPKTFVGWGSAAGGLF
jgi:hypothetical protein